MPRRCALGCSPKLRGILHKFPNPDKYPEQHESWSKIVKGDLKNDCDYEKIRICDRHFTDRDRTRSSRLSISAVPSLFLPGDSLTELKPISASISMQPGELSPQLRSSGHAFNNTFLEHNYSILFKKQTARLQSSEPGPSMMEPSPISYPSSPDRRPISNPSSPDPRPISNPSSPDPRPISNPSLPDLIRAISNPCLPNPRPISNPLTDPTLVSHPSLTGPSPVYGSQKATTTELMVPSKYRKMRKVIKNLRREILRQRKKQQFLKNRLQKADSCSNKETLNQLLDKMTNCARIFTIMQIQQTPKPEKARRFTFEEKMLSLSLYERSPECYTLMSELFTLPSIKCIKRLMAEVVTNPSMVKII